MLAVILTLCGLIGDVAPVSRPCVRSPRYAIVYAHGRPHGSWLIVPTHPVFGVPDVIPCPGDWWPAWLPVPVELWAPEWAPEWAASRTLPLWVRRAVGVGQN